jgi:hypothetical protein
MTLSLEPLGDSRELAAWDIVEVVYDLRDMPHLDLLLDAEGISLCDETDAAGYGLAFVAEQPNET